MHPTLRKGMNSLGKVATGLALVAAAGGLFYRGCLRETTIEDTVVTGEKSTWARDPETGLDFNFHYITLDKYKGWVETRENIDKGDHLSSVTIESNWILGDRITNYSK